MGSSSCLASKAEGCNYYFAQGYTLGYSYFAPFGAEGNDIKLRQLNFLAEAQSPLRFIKKKTLRSFATLREVKIFSLK